jgi:hypothetical protein
MKWKVFLNGYLNDLKELCEVFKSGKICVFKEEERYFLYCDKFANKETGAEVKNLAYKLIRNINGITILKKIIYQPIELDFIELNLKNGKKKYFKYLSGKIAVTSKTSGTLQVFNKKEKEIIGKPTHNLITEYVAKSLDNEEVNKLFDIILKEKYKWQKLYPILEHIQDDLGGKQDEQIVKKGWATKKELRRFRDTSNNPDAIGLDSRHIKKRKGKPSKDKPMPLSDAEIFINRIANHWLNEKLI